MYIPRYCSLRIATPALWGSNDRIQARRAFLTVSGYPCSSLPLQTPCRPLKSLLNGIYSYSIPLSLTGHSSKLIKIVVWGVTQFPWAVDFPPPLLPCSWTDTLFHVKQYPLSMRSSSAAVVVMYADMLIRHADSVRCTMPWPG